VYTNKEYAIFGIHSILILCLSLAFSSANTNLKQTATRQFGKPDVNLAPFYYKAAVHTQTHTHIQHTHTYVCTLYVCVCVLFVLGCQQRFSLSCVCFLLFLFLLLLFILRFSHLRDAIKINSFFLSSSRLVSFFSLSRLGRNYFKALKFCAMRSYFSGFFLVLSN